MYILITIYLVCLRSMNFHVENPRLKLLGECSDFFVAYSGFSSLFAGCHGEAIWRPKMKTKSSLVDKKCRRRKKEEEEEEERKKRNQERIKEINNRNLVSEKPF